MNQTKYLVAVDLGSNSFHLVIAREQAGCIKIVHSQKQRVSLVEGLNTANLLGQEAIDRGIECLKEFRNSFSHLSAFSVRVVATHALRSAVNNDVFLQAALKVFPYPIEIISGETEAALIYQGVAYTQPIEDQTLIIDIGGGSTEVIIGKQFKPQLINSLAIGSGSFSAKFFGDGVISAEKMRDAQNYATNIIKPMADQYHRLGWQTTLGSSGSMKAISLSIHELYQQLEITQEYLYRFKKQLIVWGHCDNIPLQSIDRKRLPLISAAVAILSSFFAIFKLEQLAYSGGALREGVLYSLSDTRPDIDAHQRTINSLCRLHFIDRAFSQRVLRQLQVFNEQLAKYSQSLSIDGLKNLSWAAYLHEIGITINVKKHQKHGKYIIEHADMPGFTAIQQQILAMLVSNHKGKVHIPQLACSIAEVELCKMVQILRLAVLLARGQSNMEPASVGIHYQDDILFLKIDSTVLQQSELMVNLENEISQTAKAGLCLRLIAG